jgi:hypothetical protein
MKKYLGKTLGAALLLAASGLTMANDGYVFDVWGSGSTYWEARDQARAGADQICQQRGYAGAFVEDVDASQGAMWTFYGIAHCY